MIDGSEYMRVAKAIDFYRRRGYRWVDTPWVVDKASTEITFPGKLEKCSMGYLVGSAEQGFIKMILDGKLGPGRYVSAGPCFRFTDAGKQGKHPWFFKVELCVVDATEYSSVMSDAYDLFRELGTSNGIEGVKTNEGHDLEINGIEVGSYGMRSHEGLKYDIAYGTGLAEPRFSEAVCHANRSR